MSDGGCVVAVDVGNSTAKLLVATAAEATSGGAFRIDQAGWARQAVDWVSEIAAAEPIQWRIAGVHRGAAEQLRVAIASHNGLAEVRWINRHDVPMEVDVEAPERLGIDRLVGAFAARELCQPPLVVVDAGSAITVDWVDAEGVFGGGAILPGLRLQTTSLATGTDGLPHLDWLDESFLAVPGRKTLDAIRLGVLIGAAAAIDALVNRYQTELNHLRPVPVVVTGGDAAALTPHLTHSHRLEANLVCRGLLWLPR